MEFMRLGPLGAETPAVRHDGTVFDLSPLTRDIDGAFWESGVERTADAIAAGDLAELADAGALRVGAPVVRPMALLNIGQNYAAHAAESGAPTPTHPILFFKHPNTLVGPYDDIPMPRGAGKLDWEVELAVVIGRRAAYLASPDEAMTHVAGYSISNDVSERDWQREHGGPQWSKGKSMPASNPFGPVVVPAHELDPGSLRLWSRVNGEPRQDSVTADMVFTVAQLVWDLSQYLTLEPGDIINTGTPQGVAMSGRFPYLQVGDVLEVGIDGIGSQRSEIAAPVS